jgi:hypothetical protein
MSLHKLQGFNYTPCGASYQIILSNYVITIHTQTKQKFRAICFRPLLITALKFSFLLHSYQKDERTKPGNFMLGIVL